MPKLLSGTRSSLQYDPSSGNPSPTQDKPWKPWMTAQKVQREMNNIAMQPFVCSSCGDWLRQHCCWPTPCGFAFFILPFEMLLQLPEQKLHRHLVMALHLHSAHSHGIVRLKEHVYSKVASVRQASLFTCFPQKSVSCEILAQGSGSKPPEMH